MSTAYIQPTRTAPVIIPGWRIIECVCIKRHDYVGLIERTSKDANGFRFDYAIVRSPEWIVAHGGKLQWMRAVRFQHGSASKGRRCRARDADAWVSSLNRAYARFRDIIRRGRGDPPLNPSRPSRPPCLEHDGPGHSGREPNRRSSSSR
jgi:hypothetical protein